MEVDIILEPDLTPRQVAELGQVAEGFGVRALWTSNFFAHWDCFLSLVPLAQSTSKLLMGPLAVSPFEMHPMKIANSLLSLNEMIGGRAVIAMGAGEGNIDTFRIKRPEKIVRAVRESIDIVRRAARRQLASGYDGEDFGVTLPCAYDWVKSAPPLVYGTAYRGQMMRMEARVADGVFVGCTPPEVMAAAVAEVREGEAKREPGMAPLRINTFWGWHLKRERAAGYRESRRELPWRAIKLQKELIMQCLSEEEAQLVRDNYGNFVAAWLDRSGDVKGVPEHIPNRLAEYFTSTGGLEDLDREIERFRTFGRAGLTEVALRLHDDPMDALQIIGREVLPKLR
ncbi:MAG: LLM class flavin-dependent oxidoreductase [Steroidobacteraceae bacterium]|jgi:5,10-methylenetetrahydromethanopterin reductase|nr:LLM class flavin-dependent oxidoreductase [Steroidobacteraceae bacterium]